MDVTLNSSDKNKSATFFSVFPTELLAKHFVLGLKVRDNVLSSAFYPLGEDQHQKLHVEWIHEAEIKIARLPKVALKRQF